MAKTASPPTIPPAIAPVLLEEDVVGAGVEEDAALDCESAVCDGEIEVTAVPGADVPEAVGVDGPPADVVLEESLFDESVGVAAALDGKSRMPAAGEYMRGVRSRSHPSHVYVRSPVTSRFE